MTSETQANWISDARISINSASHLTQKEKDLALKWLDNNDPEFIAVGFGTLDGQLKQL